MTARSPVAVLALLLLGALLVVGLTTPLDSRGADDTGASGSLGEPDPGRTPATPDDTPTTPDATAGSPTGEGPSEPVESAETTSPSSSPTASPSSTATSGSGTESGPPLDARAELDPTRAASGRIGASGGELVATGADGTTYTLDVPRDALSTTVAITMTPASEVAGVDVESVLGAVALEPTGLVLDRPAALTVQPGGDLPAPPRQAGFSMAADGTDFHLRALASVSAPTLSVLELGTLGAAEMTEAQQETAASRPPAAAPARLEAELAPVLLRQRADVLAGRSSGDADAELERLLAGYVDAGVQPVLSGGLPTLADGMSAVAQGVSLLQRYELHGIRDDTRREAVRAALLTRLAELVGRASRDCTAMNAKQLQYLLAFDHQYRRLAGDAADPAVTGKVERCARFRVELTTQVRDSWDYRSPGEVHALDGRWRLRARTVLTGDGTWSAPLRAVAYDYTKTVRRVCSGTDRVSRWQDGPLGRQPRGRVEGRLTVDRNLYVGGVRDDGPRPVIEARIVEVPEQQVRAATFGSCGQSSPDRYTTTEDQFQERFDLLFDTAPEQTAFTARVRRTVAEDGVLAAAQSQTRSVDAGIDRVTTGSATLRLLNRPGGGSGS